MPLLPLAAAQRCTQQHGSAGGAPRVPAHSVTTTAAAGAAGAAAAAKVLILINLMPHALAIIPPLFWRKCLHVLVVAAAQRRGVCCNKVRS
jgi:hypothetical protein